MNAQEAKLKELKAQIKELSFGKGPRDKAKLAELREEVRKTENRINTYDGKLLRFEASKPLQNIVEREKKKVYARVQEKVQKAKEERKETAAKRHEVAKLMKLVLDTSEWVSWQRLGDTRKSSKSSKKLTSFLTSFLCVLVVIRGNF